jgi:hypothetical protein
MFPIKMSDSWTGVQQEMALDRADQADTANNGQEAACAPQRFNPCIPSLQQRRL